jgi:hypothetical protein
VTWTPKVDGVCPMGCGPHLVLHAELDSGRLVCVDPLCPRPTAAAEILADASTGHVVQIDEDSWVCMHPLRERLDGALIDDCEFTRWMYMQGARPVPVGRWLVQADEDGRWDAARWEQVEEAER